MGSLCRSGSIILPGLHNGPIVYRRIVFTDIDRYNII